MQDYLLGSSPLNLEQKKLMFALRIESQKYSNGFQNIICPSSCKKVVNNEHIYYCNTAQEIPFCKIFNGTLKEKITITKIMETKLKIREAKNSLNII